jgi:TonB family protein
VLGLVALLVVGGAGLGGLLWLKQRLGGASPSPEPSATPVPVASATAGPTPEPSAAPVLGTLGVESEPAGAAVSLNGEARGVTPLNLSDLALGEYDLKLEARGFLPFSQKVTLSDGQPVQVRATLTRPSPSQATLDVLSTPFGASVAIDGQPAGQTPLTGYKLKPGPHRVELTRPGFEPYSQSVTLQAGKSQRVDAALEPLPPPSTQAPRPEAVDTQRVYEAHDVDTRPVKVSGQSASYPERAPRLRPGESVSVRVSFVVSEAGEVTDVKVLESGGKLLDDTITAAVLKWRYTPGQKRGVPVKVQLQHKQTFRAG